MTHDDQGKDSTGAEGVKMLAGLVKPLVWRPFWNQEDGLRLCALAMAQYEYHASEKGWWFALCALHETDGIEDAKAAAQADYTARILAAIDTDAIAALVEQKVPDYCYNPEDWEYTQPWEDRGEMVESLLDYRGADTVARVKTLINGPDKWVARVPLDTDGDGEADDWEIQWFDSEEAALARLGGVE